MCDRYAKYVLVGLISGTGPGTNPVRVRNYVNSTVTKQYKFGTSVSWEGNRRSGVALAMRHRQ